MLWRLYTIQAHRFITLDEALNMTAIKCLAENVILPISYPQTERKWRICAAALQTFLCMQDRHINGNLQLSTNMNTWLFQRQQQGNGLCIVHRISVASYCTSCLMITAQSPTIQQSKIVAWLGFRLWQFTLLTRWQHHKHCKYKWHTNQQWQSSL